MLSNNEIIKMVGFLKKKIALDSGSEEYGSYLFYNNNRGDFIYSPYVAYFNSWIKEDIIKVRKYYITNNTEIIEKENILKNTRIFKKLPLYAKEKELNNIYLAYVYENIDPRLTVNINKKFEIPYTFCNFPHKIEANLFIEECNLIITKDNGCFNTFFGLILIPNTKLCVIHSDNVSLTAFILEKSDVFNKNIESFILEKNDVRMKKFQDIANNNPMNKK